MTAASSPSMQCSVNHEISPAGGCRHPFYYCSRFNLPTRGLLFLQQVILLLCSVTQTPTDQSPCTLFFTELVLLMEKSPRAISPHPLLIFSVFSRPLPTHSVYLYVPIIFRYKIFVYHNTGFSS